MAARLSTRDDYADLLDKYDTWLFDCDGVLWEGTRLIPGAVDVLAYLRSLGACPAPGRARGAPPLTARAPREVRALRDEQRDAEPRELQGQV